MAGDETPEDRLEAALERIAQIVDMRSIAIPAMVPAAQMVPAAPALAQMVPAAPALAATDFTDRLDRIIETLREALGEAQGK